MLFSRLSFYWHSLLKLSLPLLHSMKTWQLWLFSVSLSILLSEAIVVGMSLLLNGEVSFNYLLTGLVASGFVASLIVGILSYFLEKITESHYAEQALKENERKFQHLVEKLTFPLCFVNKNHEIDYINQSFENFFGYDLNDIFCIEELLLLIYPDQAYRQMAGLLWWGEVAQAIYEDRDIDPIEYNVTGKDGSVKIMLISGIFFTDGYLITFIDITEQKRVQQQLRETKAFTNNILNSLTSHIAVLDSEGIIIAVNDTRQRSVDDNNVKTNRYTVGTSYFQACQQSFEPEDIEEAITIQYGIMAVLAGTRDSFYLEYPCHSSTQQRWFCMSVTPLTGAQAGVVVNHKNITERKHMEEQLRTLSVAVEQSPASVVITDLEANLLYVNPKFTQVTGYSFAEAIGQNPRLLQSGLTTKETYEQLWDNLTHGKAWKGELFNRRKNGETYWEEAHIAPVKDLSGVTTHYVGVKIEVTQRKQAEIELHHAKEIAIAANQAKSEFLANMSHEIRTPMNAILGFSSILNDIITDSTQLYYLDAIHRSGKTLLQLINDILDLSKIEAGKFTLQYTPVSVRALVDDIRIVFSQKASDKSVDFYMLMDEKLPDKLLLDEIRLRQVLLNLVGNAVKFTEHGFVKIIVTVSFSAEAGKVNLDIEICDSGIGIPKEQHEKIFSAFTQQDNQNVAFGGTGLGLTICKRLSELMNGSINIASEVGKGSCFTLSLNNVEIVDNIAEITAPRPCSTETVQFQPALILVVDDVELNRQLINSYLAEFKELTLIEAKTGEQALSLAAHQAFDLILMDRRLPGEDGDLVCEKIKALPNCVDIPIIMISASVLTAQEMQKPVFYDKQLNKPVNKSDLLMALQSFLPVNHKPVVSPQALTVKPEQTLLEKSVDPEKLPELLRLLSFSYQERIKELGHSDAFQIDELIEIAGQVQEIAEQYRCQLLSDWANRLKRQAELFDLTMLSKTLSSFDSLIEQLKSVKAL